MQKCKGHWEGGTSDTCNQVFWVCDTDKYLKSVEDRFRCEKECWTRNILGEPYVDPKCSNRCKSVFKIDNIH